MENDDLSKVWRTGTRHPDGVTCVERAWVIRAACDVSLGSRERARLADHLGQCAGCADAWRLARDLAPAFISPAHPRATWRRWIPAAALLALTTGLAVWWSPLGAPPTSEVRGSRPELTAKPADGAILTSRPAALAMEGIEPPQLSAGAGTERFEFVILDARATELWSATSSAVPSVDVPETLDLPVGTYYWRVTALDRRPVWTSELVRFEIQER